mmetsp:Transcript_11560/g.32176  ORF Transcript_11560/g.32176 Transcript_11560/m.32176 type:complete len:224 (-) Transcript_11560:516-1187(-)
MFLSATCPSLSISSSSSGPPTAASRDLSDAGSDAPQCTCTVVVCPDCGSNLSLVSETSPLVSSGSGPLARTGSVSFNPKTFGILTAASGDGARIGSPTTLTPDFSDTSSNPVASSTTAGISPNVDTSGNAGASFACSASPSDTSGTPSSSTLACSTNGCAVATRAGSKWAGSEHVPSEPLSGQSASSVGLHRGASSAHPSFSPSLVVASMSASLASVSATTVC